MSTARPSRNIDVEVVVADLPFPRLTMAQAHELLGDNGWQTDRSKDDLDPEGERLLSSLITERHGHEFVFVTEYPVGTRPFYHLRPASNPHVTASFDLLWKGIEITTGAQREHRYDVLVAQAQEMGMELQTTADLPRLVPLRHPAPWRARRGTQPDDHGDARAGQQPGSHVRVPRPAPTTSLKSTQQLPAIIQPGHLQRPLRTDEVRQLEQQPNLSGRHSPPDVGVGAVGAVAQLLADP
jgi:hypothetical protein